MYKLPEKFNKYLPKVQERRKAIALAQNKFERLQALLEVNKDGLAKLNSTGLINTEIATARNGYISRIIELNKLVADARNELAEAQGVNEIVDEAIMQMKI